MIANLPTKIPAGTTCDTPVIGYDFQPTFVGIAGGKVAYDNKVDRVDVQRLFVDRDWVPKRCLLWQFPYACQPRLSIGFKEPQEPPRELDFDLRPGAGATHQAATPQHNPLQTATPQALQTSSESHGGKHSSAWLCVP